MSQLNINAHPSTVDGQLIQLYNYLIILDYTVSVYHVATDLNS